MEICDPISGIGRDASGGPAVEEPLPCSSAPAAQGAESPGDAPADSDPELEAYLQVRAPDITGSMFLAGQMGMPVLGRWEVWCQQAVQSVPDAP